MAELLDNVQIRARAIYLTGVARAYGYTSRPEPEDVSCECGHLLGDHHTDERGCSYASCGCAARDVA